MITLFILFFHTFISFVVCVNDLQSTVVFLPSEADDTLSTVLGRKNALRYGFHQISSCKSFQKSFLCIQKCIDLNYDVAHADKSCKCTCYIKKDRERYHHVSAATKTRWRSGAPKTFVPPWANVKKDKEGVAGNLESSNEGITAIDVFNKEDNSTNNEVTDINSNITNITESVKNTTQVILSTNVGTQIADITSVTQNPVTSAVTT